MLTKLLISILLSVVFTHTYSQISLVGKWRHVNPKIDNQDTANKNLKYSDIEIRSDSTFHIEGDSTSRHSGILGWHTGDEYNGKWELHNGNHLTFWLEPQETKMLLAYMIIKLTMEKLVLRSPSHSTGKRFDITYLRL